MKILTLLCIIFFLPEISSEQKQIPTEVFGSPPLVGTVKISPSGNKIAIFATLFFEIFLFFIHKIELINPTMRLDDDPIPDLVGSVEKKPI